MKRLFYALLSITLLSCAPPSPQKITQDQQLLELGNQYFDKGRYSDAAPYYEEIKNRFPDSPLAIEAELKVADSHFKSNQFESAQVEYESFRSLHPTHAKIPYVYVQLAQCQLEQAPNSVQKDQSDTEQALLTLNQLVTRWPNSKEAQDAKPYIEHAQEKLAKKQMYIANYYIGQRKYFPALKRLESLNSDETPAELRREALYKLGFVHYKMKNLPIARSAFEKIVDEKIDDKYQLRAKSYLARIPAEK